MQAVSGRQVLKPPYACLAWQRRTSYPTYLQGHESVQPQSGIIAQYLVIDAPQMTANLLGPWPCNLHSKPRLLLQ